MSEKLGAEQGREFDFEAIGDAIDRVLAGQRELTPAEQKNLRGIYLKLFTKLKPEQAYHARGAGREALRECVEALDSIWAAIGDALCSGKGIEKAYANAVANETRQASDKAKAALRGQGADTGTTPPEGLESALRGVMPFMRYQSVFDYDAYQAAIAEVSRVLAATQRAPVEQGRERMEYDLLWMNCISAAAQATFPKGMHPADELKLRVEAIASSMKPCKLTAPDHAREGALPSKFATYEDWIASLPKCLPWEQCDGDLPGEPHAPNCPMNGKERATFRDAFEAGRALADGKEGGE